MLGHSSRSTVAISISGAALKPCINRYMHLMGHSTAFHGYDATVHVEVKRDEDEWDAWLFRISKRCQHGARNPYVTMILLNCNGAYDST